MTSPWMTTEPLAHYPFSSCQDFPDPWMAPEVWHSILGSSLSWSEDCSDPWMTPELLHTSILFNHWIFLTPWAITLPWSNEEREQQTRMLLWQTGFCLLPEHWAKASGFLVVEVRLEWIGWSNLFFLSLSKYLILFPRKVVSPISTTVV